MPGWFETSLAPRQFNVREIAGERRRSRTALDRDAALRVLPARKEVGRQTFTQISRDPRARFEGMLCFWRSVVEGRFATAHS